MENYISKIISLIDSYQQVATEYNEYLAERNSGSPLVLSDNLSDEDVLPNTNITTSLNVRSLLSDDTNLEDIIQPIPRVLDEEFFLQNSRTILIDIFKLLNFSVISGEYISIKGFKENITAIKTELSAILENSPFFEPDVQTQIADFSRTINIALENYLLFLHDVENEFSSERVEHVFTFSHKIQNEFLKTRLPELSTKLCNYFIQNLQLSRADHFFVYSDLLFEKLFKIEHLLSSHELLAFDEITKVLKLKIGYLEHKWKARKQQENPEAIYYAQDGKTNALAEYNPDNEDLQNWLNIINSHYQLYITNWEYEITKRIKPYKDKPLSELNFIQIHQLIKYYKDVKKNSQKLTAISDYLFSKEKDSEQSFYDQYALDIITNYSHNNVFSLMVETQKSFPVIINNYKTFKEKTKGGVQNFFLDFKYLASVVDNLYKYIDEDGNIDFIKKYENLVVVECKEVFDNYFKSKEWSKTHTNYIFILPYKEALINIKPIVFDLDTTYNLSKIFIASSFVLPVVNSNVEQQFVDIKQRYRGLSIYVEIMKRLQKDLHQIKDLSSEIERRDFKSIEIISIFTAIITFVLSSIPAFKFVTTVWQSMLFMLSSASALGIFVVLILFITRGFKSKWFFIIFIAIAGLISFTGYHLLSDYEQRDSKIDETIKQKIEQQYKEVDSIRNASMSKK